jgi:hypothetical protein
VYAGAPANQIGQTLQGTQLRAVAMPPGFLQKQRMELLALLGA